MSQRSFSPNKAAFYTCTYVPLEIIWAAGFIPKRLIGQTDSCLYTDSILSRNVCPYAHSVLKAWRNVQPEKTKYLATNTNPVIIANSCDAMHKLYDILKLESDNVYLLDVPRENTRQAIDFFYHQIRALYFSFPGVEKKDYKSQIDTAIEIYKRVRRLLEEVRTFVGKKMTYSEFIEIKQNALQSIPQKALEGLAGLLQDLNERKLNNASQITNSILPVAVTGSPMTGQNIFSAIEQVGFDIFDNDSCLDLRWSVSEIETHNPGSDPFFDLAELYLNKIPCARMASRQRVVERLSEYIKEGDIEGIIHLRMPFCDLYGFDLVHLLPLVEKGRILHLDTDGSLQSLGQIRTRIQAFAEIILQKKNVNLKAKQKIKTDASYYCGIDIGSSTVDGVILSSEGKIVARSIEKTGSHPGNTSLRLYKKMIKESGVSEKAILSVMTTGYGRNSFPLSHDSVSEISCHAYGIRYFFPQVRLVIDIGGQDSKVIKIDENGIVNDFRMNDKCAAGTGRFLEVMAQALEMNINEMSEVDITGGKNVPISSVCTVFAESEVISLLGQGYPAPDIIRGLYQAITNRIEAMVQGIGLAEPIAITGGGALNHALVFSIEKRLGVPICVPDKPQIIGAIGAAILTMEKNEIR
ncbi:MAG: acyl-CoA dehydratase activase [Acidobacteriota bacterium]